MNGINIVISGIMRKTASIIQPTLYRIFFIVLLMNGGVISVESQNTHGNSSGSESASADFDQVVQAALTGDKRLLQQRLQNGKSLDVLDERGRSAILAVTMQNNMNALQLLIELGADPDYFDEASSTGVIDQTAFLYAGAQGMNEALMLLIQAGAKPDIYNHYGGTALIPAAEKGHVETVRLLLEKTAIDVNHVNHLGWTALMEAVVLSDGGIIHQQIVKLLLTHGADSSITDKEGVSVLEHARKRGYSALVELLQKGSNE